MQSPAIYYGNSMHRVFRSGDILVNDPADFEDLSVGDVILFFSPEKKKNVVHRIIAKASGVITTMGDNNDSPDPWQLTAENEIFLVRGRIDLKGKVHAVSGGAAGMRAFRRHRFCRSVRKFFSALVQPLLKICFFRRDLPEPEKFGEYLCYFWRGHLIARCREGGQIRYKHWIWKLFFRSPEKSDKNR